LSAHFWGQHELAATWSDTMRFQTRQRAARGGGGGGGGGGETYQRTTGREVYWIAKRLMIFYSERNSKTHEYIPATD
jgi:hypothetical protein